ncbi:MAG: cupin domain-containing protein [Methanocalculus sp.]|uniref:cupin domain-containing protein n=1 Tax=Methanocalculus sp. TaxID=2004547 RepID=UPI0027215C3E|nr:cupin domain-containing protein [Methanocalculus sp.]MDO9539018.1 cupin domain-containing protein [Methanocalculus sp.]
MKRLVLLLTISLLLSAGCISDTPQGAEGQQLLLIEPSEPFPIYEGQGMYTWIIHGDTPIPPLNYSFGLVTIAPGNATPPHRLIGTSELVYVIKGTARIMCDNEEVTAGEGVLVLLPEGVLQSISTVGTTELHYLSVNQPPFREESHIQGEDLTLLSMSTSAVPITIRDPNEHIEWDFNTGTLIYTLVNPQLMQDMDIPIDYSVAYTEILPGGSVVKNQLEGLSELLYVIEGEIVVSSPEYGVIRVPAGSAGYVQKGIVKEFFNQGNENAKVLSFVDPAWVLEKALIIE